MPKQPSKPVMPRTQVAALMSQKMPKPNPDYSSSDLAKELGKRQRKRKLTAE